MHLRRDAVDWKYRRKLKYRIAFEVEAKGPRLIFQFLWRDCTADVLRQIAVVVHYL